jgi:hypothetical protein
LDDLNEDGDDSSLDDLNGDGDDSSLDGLNEDGDDSQSLSDGLNDDGDDSQSLSDGFFGNFIRIIPTRSCSRSPSPTMRLLEINEINDTIYFNFGEDWVGYGDKPFF